MTIQKDFRLQSVDTRFRRQKRVNGLLNSDLGNWTGVRKYRVGLGATVGVWTG